MHYCRLILREGQVLFLSYIECIQFYTHAMHRMTHSHDQLTFSKPLSHVTWTSRRLPIHRRISHAVVDRVYPRDSLGVRKIHVHPPADHPLRLRLCGEFVLRRAENVRTVVAVFKNCTLERERDKGRAEPREGTKRVAVRGWRTTASNACSGFHLLRNTCPPLSFRVLD